MQVLILIPNPQSNIICVYATLSTNALIYYSIVATIKYVLCFMCKILWFTFYCICAWVYGRLVFMLD